MTAHCRQCDHEWEVLLPLPMLIERAVTVMKGAVAAGCPNCRAFGLNVLCGPATRQATPPEPARGGAAVR